MADEWWQSFFSGPPVDFWLAATTDEQTRLETDFLQKSLGLTPQSKVLDVPCGAGRHGLELAARGLRVTGVDISTEFLAVAKSRAAERGLGVDWQHREMRDLPWESEFDGAFCFGNSFGILDEAGNADFVKAVARSLKPKGRFALDIGHLAESILPNFHERNWFEAGDILLIVRNRFDHVRSRLHTDYTFVRSGQRETRSGSHRIYTYAELSRLLRESGFAEVKGYCSLGEEAYHLGSPRILMVAVK